MDERLRKLAEAAKGYMPPDEGLALYEAAKVGASLGPLVEIGSYCGKSTIYLGAAALEAGARVLTIDHHRGSIEMQSDWEHHDPDVVDARTGRMDSLPHLRRTLEEAGLEEVVIAVVADSKAVAATLDIAAGFVFIDGGHDADIAMSDYRAWSPKLVRSGVLAIHDVFADPADGGQGPYEVFRRAVSDGFSELSATGSLRVLKAS